MSKRIKEIIFFSFIFVVSFMLFYINIVNSRIDSDQAYYAIAGKDILSGNILLKGWYGSTNTFYVLCLLSGIVGKLIGYGPWVVWTVSALLFAFLVWSVTWLTFEINKQKADNERIIRVIISWALCLVSSYLIGNGILAGAHLAEAVIGYLYIFIISREIMLDKIKKFEMFFISILLFLAICSDSLVMYFIVFPVILALVIFYIWGEINREQKKIILQKLILTIFVVIFAKGFMYISTWYFHGIKSMWSTTNKVSIITWDILWDRLAFCIEEYLYIFSADVFGKEISLYNCGIFIRFLFLMVLIVGIIISTKKLMKNIYNIMLVLSALMLMCIVVFTNYVQLTDGIEYTSRVMYYIFIPTILLASQIEWRKYLKLLKINIIFSNKMMNIFVGMVFIFFIILNIREIEYNSEKQMTSYDKVVTVLNEKNLKYGYGTFWLANITTLFAECEIYVNPICNSKDLSKYQWLSFDTQRWNYANFVLVDDSNWDGVTRDTIVESIGIPDEEIQIDTITIMIWDKNIMPYINNSGSAQNIEYWWDLNGENEKVIPVTNKHFYSWFEADESGKFVSSGEGYLIYGPFQHLEQGEYDITFTYEYAGETEVNEVIGYVDVFSAKNMIEYVSKEVIVGQNSITIQNVVVPEECNDAEFRVYVYSPGVTITEIKYRKSNEI